MILLSNRQIGHSQIFWQKIKTHRQYISRDRMGQQDRFTDSTRKEVIPCQHRTHHIAIKRDLIPITGKRHAQRTIIPHLAGRRPTSGLRKNSATSARANSPQPNRLTWSLLPLLQPLKIQEIRKCLNPKLLDTKPRATPLKPWGAGTPGKSRKLPPGAPSLKPRPRKKSLREKLQALPPKFSGMAGPAEHRNQEPEVPFPKDRPAKKRNKEANMPNNLFVSYDPFGLR